MSKRQDRVARALTSSATTENPLPASPALAASIAAFKANRLVWSEIAWIVSSTLAMVSVFLVNDAITSATSCIFLLTG